MTYLLDAVEKKAQQAGARRVLAINLVMGERSSILDDSLLFYFDMLTPGTLADGARLCIHRTTMRFHCASCAIEYSPVKGDFSCPQCGNFGQVTEDGSELLIDSIEVET